MNLLVSAVTEEVNNVDVAPRRSGRSFWAPEIRVLQIFDSLGMGGAETWLMALLRFFHSRRNDLPMSVRFDVLLTGGAKARFDDEAEALGARLFYANFSRRNTFGFIRQFRRILAKGRYHAIHDHQDYAAGFRFIMGLGLLPNVRVAHIHNTPFSVARYNSTPSRLLGFRLAKGLLAVTSTHIASTSRQMIKEFGFDTWSFRRIEPRVVHCGFDTSSFRGDNKSLHRELSNEFGWTDNVKIILFVGRLEEPVGSGLQRKNPAFALEVGRACIARDGDVRMIMAGSGDQMRRNLTSRIKSWGLEDKMKLPGVYPDISRLMLGSNLFLFPSLAEGLGMVVVEAQAAGLRVLTSTGVPRESTVIPGLVEFRKLDAGVEIWASEALRLLNLEPTDPRACCMAVQNSAFSIEQSAKSLMEIYSGTDNISM